MTEIATDDAGVSSHPWANRDGACAARFLESFATACDLLGEMMPDAALAVMEEMALQETVPPDTPGHPRINIWGPLESRLQTADRLIVASLNERQWPEQPGADAFLPRHFRAKLGLPDPDARIGLSAHDFAQIASAPDVILLRSRRRDRRPAVASRWVWRLRTLVQGATPGGDHDLLRPALGIDALELARELVRAEPAPPLAPPRPTPPSETFPERISVTDVSTLIRDPYAIYASKILRLSSLDPVGGDLGGRDYGSAVHSAIEHCLKAGTLAPDHLYNALITALEDAGFTTDQMIERSAVLPLVADGLANILAELAQDMASQRIEEKMTTALRVQKRTITLVGQADLIHRHRDNSATIIDWKTSTYGLTKNNIRAHLEPQLPLLGFLALNELEDIHDIRAMKLVEVRWKGKEALEEVVAPEEDSTGDPLIGASHNGLQSLLSQYLFGGRPFLSRPRPLSVTIYGEYDRLARFAEWGDVLGEDE